MRLVAFIAVVVTGALLLYASGDFPDWGDAHSPANDYLISRHYIEKTYEETSVPNMVTAVLADYRGYDTLFETVVIFTAGIAIIAILRGFGAPDQVPGAQPQSKADLEDLIVVWTVRLLTPVIQLFALYVVAHGHHSPGGGFQGGVILGASFILIAISRSLRTALGRFPERWFMVLAGIGIFLYAGFGVAAQMLGGNFLDYGALHRVLPWTEIEARSQSMLGVEIGVALTVTAIMFAIYANLASHGRLKRGL